MVLDVARCPDALASESFLEELKAGFVEFRRRQWVPVTACYLVVLAFAFNGPIFALGPAAALSRLGGPSAWSLMLSAFGVGLIAGSLLAPKLLRTQRALGWSYLGNLSVVPMLFLLGTSHSEWLVVGSSALAGIAVGVFGVTYPTLLQQTIPKEKLSRVVSYFWLARVAAAPLAFAIVGPLSARFGTPACSPSQGWQYAWRRWSAHASPECGRFGLAQERSTIAAKAALAPPGRAGGAGRGRNVRPGARSVPCRRCARRDTLPGFSRCMPGATPLPGRWCRAVRREPASREGTMAVTDYEVTYILRPSLEETEVDERANAIAEGVKTRGGEIVGELEKLGKRRLAYEIDNVREGYYVVMKFKSEPEGAKELERLMRLNESILRALVIRQED